MLKIKIKATGQIIEVKDFSRIIIDEENEEIRELSLNEVEFIEEDKEDEKHRDMIASVDLGHKDDITVETTFRKDKIRKIWIMIPIFFLIGRMSKQGRCIQLQKKA